MVQICTFRNFKSKIGCLISIISEKCKKIYMINRIPSYQCEFSVRMQIIINFLVIWFSYPRRDIALRCQFCLAQWCYVLYFQNDPGDLWVTLLWVEKILVFQASDITCKTRLSDDDFHLKRYSAQEAVERWSYNPKVWKALSCACMPLWHFRPFSFFTSTRNNLCPFFSSISFLYLLNTLCQHHSR